MKLTSKAEAALNELVSNEAKGRLVSNPHRGMGLS